MKWKLIYVVISLLSISVVGCWPPFAPPAPPPPPPLLYEDHYLRFQGPYDRGINQMASHPSGEAVHPMGTHHVNHQIFFPVSHLNQMSPPLTFPEPEESGFPNGHNFDLGNAQEFVDFSPPEPHLMKIRHMNYRYRKRLRTQKPVEEEGFGHHKEVKYSQSFSSPPKRYNVIDSRGEHQKRIPNSVNDKLEPKKFLIEEESHRQNTSTNKIEKFDRKTEIRAQNFRDLQENRSQNSKDTSKSIRPTVDMPIDVTSYSMKSPDGGVTQVTEMLYDVENNPFKVSTSTPIMTPVWRPSTPLFKTVTEEPLVTQTPYLNKAYSETESGSTIKIPPEIPIKINDAVTAKFNDITMSPVLSFTTQSNNPRNTMDPFLFDQSSTITAEPTLSPTPPRLRPTVLPSDYYSRRSRKRSTTQKPHTTSSQRESSARESKAGLSGAAIAGIVIGSMVSIMLLAGTSLFVMYRNPFRRSLSPQRSSESLPNPRPTEANTVPRLFKGK